jgi:hypothetical protein
MTSRTDISRSSCNFLTCSFRSRASFSSSFASAIWVSVVVCTALQNAAQLVCLDPVTFCRTLGIDLHTVLINRPLVSGIAAASHLILSAQTTCASSSTPFVVTHFPTSSSLILVCSNAACFSSTVFTVGILLGHHLLNARTRWSQVSLSLAIRLSNHCSAAAFNFRLSPKFSCFCSSVALVLLRPQHCIAFRKSWGLSSGCSSSPQNGLMLSGM